MHVISFIVWYAAVNLVEVLIGLSHRQFNKKNSDHYFGSSNVGFVFGSFLPSPAGFAELSSTVSNSMDISTFPWKKVHFLKPLSSNLFQSYRS